VANSRSTRRTKRIVANMRAARAQPCMRCGQAIDYDAAIGEPDAFNAGHIKSWAHHPELREDPANYQPEHERCNKSAGTRDGRDNDLGMQTESW